MKRCTALSALLACAILATSLSAAEPKTETDKTFYALGHVISSQLQNFAMSDSEMEVLIQGLRDGLKGKDPGLDLMAYQGNLQSLAAERAQVIIAKQKEKGEAFCATKAEEKGAVRTDSGLVFKSVRAGEGATPTAEDKVQVHYRGTLIDGTEFDSSYEKGKPAEFPVSGVISCWTEALQRMKVGGKAEIACPADIAYGDRGRPGRIPPGATLVFEVELLDIL